MSFDAQKFLLLIKSNVVFYFIDCTFGAILESIAKSKVMKMYTVFYEFYGFSYYV